MRIQKTTKIFCLFFAVVLCVSLFTACQKFEKIEASQVERVVIWVSQRGEFALDAEDSAKVIELYNTSKHGGEATGEGFTPLYGFDVYFHDGSHLRAREHGIDFLEVFHYDKNGENTENFYAKSQELCDFVEALRDKVTESSE